MLLSRDEVYSEGIGVVGVSKGGDIALLMGAHCPKVRKGLKFRISGFFTILYAFVD